MTHFHAVLPDGSHIDALGGVSLLQPGTLKNPVYKTNAPIHPALLGFKRGLDDLKKMVAFSGVMPSQHGLKTPNEGNLSESDRLPGESLKDYETRCFAIVTREKNKPQYALHGDLSALAAALPDEDAKARDDRLWSVITGLMGK